MRLMGLLSCINYNCLLYTNTELPILGACWECGVHCTVADPVLDFNPEMTR